MTTIGLDLGDRVTHLCGLNAQRDVVLRTRFDTCREAVEATFGTLPRCLVVLEAGTQSRWMAAQIERLGHQVQVADPRRVALISKSRRKTDRRDAEVLARFAAGMPELLGSVRHRGDQAQADLALERARDLLVRMRTKGIQHVRSTVKMFGMRIQGGGPDSFHRTAREQIPALLQPALLPILDRLGDLTKTIRKLERELKAVERDRYPEAAKLRAVNGVGPVISLAYVLTIEDPSRFARSRDVGAWVGLCPKVRASGDRNPELSISKCGDKHLRRLLVQGAQYILGPHGTDSYLRRYGLKLLERGGKAARRRAVVAVARKLAVLLHHLWRSGEVYDPFHNAQRAKAGRTSLAERRAPLQPA